LSSQNIAVSFAWASDVTSSRSSVPRRASHGWAGVSRVAVVDPVLELGERAQLVLEVRVDDLDRDVAS
jgi:hypothetical protein